MEYTPASEAGAPKQGVGVRVPLRAPCRRSSARIGRNMVGFLVAQTGLLEALRSWLSVKSELRVTRPWVV